MKSKEKIKVGDLVNIKKGLSDRTKLLGEDGVSIVAMVRDSYPSLVESIDYFDGTCLTSNGYWIRLDLIEKVEDNKYTLDEIKQMAVYVGRDLPFPEKVGVKRFVDYLTRKQYEEEQILDETEKRYLKSVIRPFRDKIESIKLFDCGDICYIKMDMDGDDTLSLPNFKKGTMYKRMEANRCYTIDELGL